ncbi:siphovirus Gp157 family protein [Endozoicomonas euniceicola]|uniref:Siphovirus Gp157 family protein n=1 Tax=Endozoicomonas euniceicola TaxID=1234143 RepID=A0ABY6H217_9GAMM|nr:siphovirus Gp157 family protein [Endozoicomonas euniceicola]UYM18283.1 siphovirus Gp157 family protein [Endozoicomonas euniceicola]
MTMHIRIDSQKKILSIKTRLTNAARLIKKRQCVFILCTFPLYVCGQNNSTYNYSLSISPETTVAGGIIDTTKAGETQVKISSLIKPSSSFSATTVVQSSTPSLHFDSSLKKVFFKTDGGNYTFATSFSEVSGSVTVSVTPEGSAYPTGRFTITPDPSLSSFSVEDIASQTTRLVSFSTAIKPSAVKQLPDKTNAINITELVRQLQDDKDGLQAEKKRLDERSAKLDIKSDKLDKLSDKLDKRDIELHERETIIKIFGAAEAVIFVGILVTLAIKYKLFSRIRKGCGFGSHDPEVADTNIELMEKAP